MVLRVSFTKIKQVKPLVWLPILYIFVGFLEYKLHKI